MVLHKIFKYSVLVLCLVAAALFIYTMVTGDEVIETDGAAQGSTIVPLMYVAYIIMAVAVALVLVFVIVNLFGSAARLKMALLSIGIMLGVILIAYFVFAVGDDASYYNEVVDTGGDLLTEGESKLIGASLYTFYIIAVLAIASILWAGVNKLIKK